MRLITLMIIGFLMSFQVKGQKLETTVLIGEAGKAKRSEVHNSIPLKDGGLLVVSSRLERLYLLRYDKNLKLVKRSKEFLFKENKRVKFKEFLKFNDKYYFLFTFTNTERRKDYLFIQELNVETMEYGNDIRKLAEISTSQKQFVGRYTIIQSPDKSKLLVTAESPVSVDAKYFFFFKTTIDKPGSSNGKKISYWLYDKEFKLLNSKRKYKISGESTKYKIHDIICNNNGDVLLVGRERIKYKNKYSEVYSFDGNFNRKDPVKPVKYILVYFLSDKEDALRYYFGSKDNKVLSLKASFNPKGNITCIGLYTEELKGAKGSFYSELDSDDLEELSFVKSEFDKSFVENQNKTRLNNSSNSRETRKLKRKISKKKMRIQDSEVFLLNTVTDILYDQNDKTIGVFEKQWTTRVEVTTTSSNGNSTTRVYPMYKYGNTVITGYDSNGDLEEVNFVPNYYSIINNYLKKSYVNSLDGDNLNMVYYNSICLFNLDKFSYKKDNITDKLNKQLKKVSKSKNIFASHAYQVFINKNTCVTVYRYKKKLIPVKVVIN